MCFHEFGMFVDGFGRRTRQELLYWAQTPLGFLYVGGIIYVAYLNGLEMRFLSQSITQPSRKCSFVFPNLRFLSHGMDPNSIYVATIPNPSWVKLVCLKGQRQEDENSNQLSNPSPTKQLQSKSEQRRKVPTGSSCCSHGSVATPAHQSTPSLPSASVASTAAPVSSVSSDLSTGKPSNVDFETLLRKRVEERKRRQLGANTASVQTLDSIVSVENDGNAQGSKGEFNNQVDDEGMIFMFTHVGRLGVACRRAILGFLLKLVRNSSIPC